jgi:hypothetical protein
VISIPFALFTPGTCTNMQAEGLIANWSDVPCGIRHTPSVYPFQEFVMQSKASKGSIRASQKSFWKHQKCFIYKQFASFKFFLSYER